MWLLVHASEASLTRKASLKPCRACWTPCTLLHPHQALCLPGEHWGPAPTHLHSGCSPACLQGTLFPGCSQSALPGLHQDPSDPLYNAVAFLWMLHHKVVYPASCLSLLCPELQGAALSDDSATLPSLPTLYPIHPAVPVTPRLLSICLLLSMAGESLCIPQPSFLSLAQMFKVGSGPRGPLAMWSLLLSSLPC